MATNKKVVKLLSDHGYIQSDTIVRILIDNGLLQEDQQSEPEKFAQAARDWVGDRVEKNVFDYASGWSTGAWETVLKETIADRVEKTQNVFYALVILAKEAGIEL
jgi:hypothetical protein